MQSIQTECFSIKTIYSTYFDFVKKIDRNFPCKSNHRNILCFFMESFHLCTS